MGDNIYGHVFYPKPYKKCIKIQQDINDSTTNTFHLEVISISKPYHAQIRHHTCRIHVNFLASQACTRRCNIDLNHKCYMSLHWVQYEYKVL